MKNTSFLLLFILLLVLSGCQSIDPAAVPPSDVEGRVILWHSWTGQDEQELQSVLSAFSEIYPGIVVVDLQIPQKEMLEQLKQKGNQAVGPDLAIGDAIWIPELAVEGIIEPYGKENGLIMGELPKEAVTFNDQIFGLPLFVRPFALYYNQSLVEQPPTIIDDLMGEVSRGNTAAFIPRFREAYWGIEAFGPDLFDDDGNLDLADSGFLPWLNWLGAAQNETGLIMNVDDQRLEELFSAGEITYYIAEPWKITRLQEALGEDLAVSIIPSGPSGAAGPLLNAEAILFFSYSSAKQAEMVRILGEFLANPQQSIRFMREIDKVPANPRVSIDSRLYPVVASFSQQARTAVTIPGGWDEELLISAGDRAYAAVLSGEMPADQAVCTFARIIGQGQVPMDKEILLPDNCEVNVETDGS